MALNPTLTSELSRKDMRTPWYEQKMAASLPLICAANQIAPQEFGASNSLTLLDCILVSQEDAALLYAQES